MHNRTTYSSCVDGGGSCGFVHSRAYASKGAKKVSQIPGNMKTNHSRFHGGGF